MQKVNNLRFLSDSTIDITDIIKISQNMAASNDELNQVLKYDYRMDNFKYEVIQRILDNIKPANMILTLQSNSFEDEADKIEPFYKTKYKVEDLTNIIKDDVYNDETLSRKYQVALNYPEINNLIPTDFRLKYEGELDLDNKPEIIIDDQKLELWWMQDKEFFLPKFSAKIIFYIDEIEISNSNVNNLMFNMWFEELNIFLRNLHRQCSIAGFSFDFQADDGKFILSMSGFNDSLNKFTEKLGKYFYDFINSEPKESSINELVKAAQDN